MSNNRYSLSLNTKKHQDYVISILFEEFGDGRSFAEFTKDILYELGMKNCKSLRQKKGLVALKTIMQDQVTPELDHSRPKDKPKATNKKAKVKSQQHLGNEKQGLGVTLDDVMKLKIT